MERQGKKMKGRERGRETEEEIRRSTVERPIPPGEKTSAGQRIEGKP